MNLWSVIILQCSYFLESIQTRTQKHTQAEADDNALIMRRIDGGVSNDSLC